MKPRYQVAAVTGASRGIGRALAREIHRHGAAVGLLARNEEELTSLSKEIEEEGGRALVAVCDVTDKARVASALDEVTAAFGPIDLLVANAGIAHILTPMHFDLEEVEHLYRVNVLGAVYSIYHVLPSMLERGRGHVVGISSLASYQGVPGSGEYCGSKAALRIHLEALRAELAPKGVRVTTVCPGYVRTPLTDRHDFDMPLLMDVERAAGKIMRAILRRKRVYAFPWPMVLGVRVGQHVPRRLFDWAVRHGPKHGTRTQPKSGEHA